MTIRQLYLFNALYLVLTTVVAIVTRATPRRIAGALAGAALCGPVGAGIIVVGQTAGWWHIVTVWQPYWMILMWIDLIVCGYVFLITWRIARRFGARGIAVVLLVAAIIGPVRDYGYMSMFPEWGSYAPGVAPVLAISAAYVILISVGHACMRLIAGPASADPLVKRPWEPR